jgi:hypothetical protein
MTACDDAAVEEGRATSSVLVECRICQDDDDEAYMEAPCSCKGSLKVKRHHVSAILFQRKRFPLFTFQQYGTC